MRWLAAWNEKIMFSAKGCLLENADTVSKQTAYMLSGAWLFRRQ